jgi:shikimate kinase
MKIVLLGYMGSGKSTVGKSLATTLNLPFKDLDNEIEKQEKSTISNIFSEKGEIYFRKKENELLQNLISKDDSFVLALGGGTPLYYNAATYLKNREDVITFYLSASISTLTKRLFPQIAERPLLNHCTTEAILSEFIAKHLFERNPVYNTASIIINTDKKEPKEIVSQIVARLF